MVSERDGFRKDKRSWHGVRFQSIDNAQQRPSVWKPNKGVRKTDTDGVDECRPVGLMSWWHQLRLRSRDPETRRKAVADLSAVEPNRALQTLVEFARDPDSGVRCEVVRLLALCEYPDATRTLHSLLRDPQPQVRCAAAAALGPTARKEACAWLVPLLRDREPQVRCTAAQSLRTLGWRPANGEEASLFEMSLGDRRASVVMTGAAVQTMATQLLQHDTAFFRRAAAEALGRAREPERIAPLLTALKDADPVVRVSAIHALAQTEEGEVANALLHCLRDASPQVRLAALQALDRAALPEHAPWIVPMLRDGYFEVRLTAVNYVRKVGHGDAAPDLVNLLQDPDGDVRLAAAKALGAFRSSLAIPALILTLTDEERAIREAAAAALAAIDPEWAVSPEARLAQDALVPRLSDPRPWVSAAACQVLAKLRDAKPVSV